jgi:hypothetical protein
MANRARTHGGKALAKATAFVLPTPVSPRVSGLVHFALRYLNRHRDTEQNTARLLSFIPFLHWAIVKRARLRSPGAPEGRKSGPVYDCNLFLSTFDGPWRPYVQAFTDVLDNAIDFVWGFSVGYPGSQPESRYERYIVLNQVDAEHNYTAYPGASVRDVRRTLHLQRELTAFAERTRALSDDQFAQEYRRLLIRVQNDLGAIGPLPAP